MSYTIVVFSILPVKRFTLESLQISYKIILLQVNMSLVMRKPAFRICENKDADQLRGNREADQRLCFSLLG